MRTLNPMIPESWPKSTRSSMLQVVSLAHWAIVHARSWAADSKLQRVRLAGELERARNEMSLLREEIRIKDMRMCKIPARQRPHYPPEERMAILQMRAARAWNLAQTARAFLVEPETVALWMRRIDEDGGQALVRLPVPVNRFPDFVRHVVCQLKILCPTMGKRRIADTLPGPAFPSPPPPSVVFARRRPRPNRSPAVMSPFLRSAPA